METLRVLFKTGTQMNFVLQTVASLHLMSAIRVGCLYSVVV